MKKIGSGVASNTASVAACSFHGKPSSHRYFGLSSMGYIFCETDTSDMGEVQEILPYID